MRILGIDYGEKRIGVAVSDPLGLTAQPVDAVEDIEGIKRIVKEYDEVEEVVVGLPKSLSGKLGPQAQKVLEFVEKLKKDLRQRIITWDERLTTVEAEKVLISAGLSRQKRKEVVDKSAAAIILQSYLDSKGR